ncbi:MAG: tRNA uridine-5-carboxymethylaminomethyl(34) synthesis GTPase MnmE [Candidatus Obscuribacterales bacterium]|nr:tRNA uridine-5-carboxymethylaminomethyl(34) synthesis GTPase MnmE [Cyanobacteria bacterium SZAS LIN-5]
MNSEETIAAISTAPGTGAIAIVRMTGPQAWTITGKIFCSKKNKPLLDSFKSHSAIHGFIRDERTDQIVDEVVVIPYKGPNSYTGEDLVEINCHGGQIVTSEILSLCLANGARLARQGEFTQRAYLNGRMDLTQAEAVLDVIQAKTGLQSRFAVSALKGELGGQIEKVRVSLVELLSRIVAGLDFPDEVGDLPLDDLEKIVQEAVSELKVLLNTARSGRFLREGVRVAIAGKPNAGKSSLLNQLLKFERAIVTDVPGTTRDSLEELLDINGIPVLLIDTAGIRSTEDQVEQIGIERTRKAIAQSDLVLLVTDVLTGWTEDDQLVLDIVDDRPHIILANKVDAQPNFQVSDLYKSNAQCLGRTAISAKTGSGIETLNEIIEKWVFNDQQLKDAGGSLNARQGELCERALRSLALVQETAENDMPQDCLATDLKMAIDSLYEMSGEMVSEAIITNVFAKFCIGK